jgi:hypothetical protein
LRTYWKKELKLVLIKDFFEGLFCILLAIAGLVLFILFIPFYIAIVIAILVASLIISLIERI